MAGEAVSGRYAAARHAVADGAVGHVDEPQRHPASDDRSLVDRLLASNEDDHVFDWGWGNPATSELVTDREPLHDIPELRGPDERATRDAGKNHEDDSDAPERGTPFPSPRLLDDPLDSGPLDEGRGGDVRSGAEGRDPGSAEREPGEVVGGGFYGDRRLDDRGADRDGPDGPDDRAADHGEPGGHRFPARDWDDRRFADLGAYDLGADDAGADNPCADDLGADDLGADVQGPDGQGYDHRRPGDPGFGARRLDDRDRPDRSLDSDPLDALSTSYLRLAGDAADGMSDRDEPGRDQPNSDQSGGDQSGSDQPGSDQPGSDQPGSDQPGSDQPGSDQPGSDQPGGDQPDGDQPKADRLEPSSWAGSDRDSPHPGRLDRDPRSRSPFDSGAIAPKPQERDPEDHDRPDRAPRELGRSYRDLLDPDSNERDRLNHGVDGGPSSRGPVGGYPWDLDRPYGGPLEGDSGDRERSDPLGRDAGQKSAAADPRLRRWADRYRPSGSPGDRPSSEPPPRDMPAASGLLEDPISSDSIHTGRIEIGEGLVPRTESPPPVPTPQQSGGRTGEPPEYVQYEGRLAGAPSENLDSPIHAPDFRSGTPADSRGADPAYDPAGSAAEIRDPYDAAPVPTTVFGAIDPVGPATRGAPEEPKLPLQEYAARRHAAEMAAASAEEVAASAAERASAAIAAAARAAAEAETAADAAARAAEEANDAAAAEVRAIADAVARGEGPGQHNGRAEESEPPTQAVPLITSAGAPAGQPPQRRPAGPPPRGHRPDEPSRTGALHRPASARGRVDGETTAVLTGLEGLRGPGPSRGAVPAPEISTVAKRRPVAEPATTTDGTEAMDGAADAAEAEHEDRSSENSLLQRLTTRPILAAVGVGGVLAVAAVVAVLTTSESDPPPAEAAPAAVTSPVAVQPAPMAPAVDADGARAVAFLTALRDDDIPTSSSGQAETEAAAMICAQLDQGAGEAQLARSVPAVLPDVTRGQASDVVDYAQQYYC